MLCDESAAEWGEGRGAWGARREREGRGNTMLGISVGGGQALMGRGLNVVMWVHGAATHSEMDRMHRPAPGGEGAGRNA